MSTPLAPATIALYSPGGSAYAQLQATYGTAGADLVYQDAIDGGSFGNAIEEVRFGNFTGDNSTLGNFWTQITTDPLAAPLESANNQLGLAVWNVVKNPFVLLAVAVAVFYFVGGFGWLQRRVAKAG